MSNLSRIPRPKPAIIFMRKRALRPLPSRVMGGYNRKAVSPHCAHRSPRVHFSRRSKNAGHGFASSPPTSGGTSSTLADTRYVFRIRPDPSFKIRLYARLKQARYQSLCASPQAPAPWCCSGDHFLYFFFHHWNAFPLSPRRRGHPRFCYHASFWGVPAALPAPSQQGRIDGVAFNGNEW